MTDGSVKGAVQGMSHTMWWHVTSPGTAGEGGGDVIGRERNTCMVFMKGQVSSPVLYVNTWNDPE